MERRQVVGMMGAFMLFIGVFAPIVSIPVVGSIIYFETGRGDGVAVLFLATVSFLLLLAKRYRGLWLTGLASLGVLVFSFITLLIKISEMRNRISVELASNPFRGLTEIAVQSVFEIAIQRHAKRVALMPAPNADELQQITVGDVTGIDIPN